MQITIHDHDCTQYGKRAGFLFNIVFSIGNEHEFGISRNLAANFSDFAAWLQAAGEIDGYDDSDDEGEIWVQIDRCYSYTFDEYIKEHMRMNDRMLREYVAAQVSFAATSVVEDIALI